MRLIITTAAPAGVVRQDLAVQTAAAITAIYPTLASRQILYLLNDCGMVVVSNRTAVDKIAAIRAQAPGLATTIVMDADGQPWPERGVTLAHVAARGHQRLLTDASEACRFEARATGIRRDAVAYTYLYAGATVVCAESPATLARDMVTVRPTLMIAVPRVFEKLCRRSRQGRAGVPHAPGPLPLGCGCRPAALGESAPWAASWRAPGTAVSRRRLSGIPRHSRGNRRPTPSIGIRQRAFAPHGCAAR